MFLECGRVSSPVFRAYKLVLPFLLVGCGSNDLSPEQNGSGGSSSSSGGSANSSGGSTDCGDRCGAGEIVLAAGDAHTCALTSDGRILCWGRNNFGQLGDGTTTDSGSPIEGLGLQAPNLAVSAGYSHTCALTAAGGVKCWGRNSGGELGRAGADSPTPVDATDLTTGVAAVSVGTDHTCVLTSAGGVKCWGWNNDGALGNNTRDNSTTPVDVIDLTSGATVVSAGGTHTCALVTGGGVKRWGSNVDGELGDKGYIDSLSPVDVVGLSSGVRWLSAGVSHTCVVTEAGGVQCWGDNDDGQLGDGSKESSNVPVDVSGLSSGFTAVAAGGRHTCALSEAGGVKCWGYNVYGELGSNSPSSVVPVDVDGLSSGVVSLAAGSDHTCAVTSAGTVKCWGRNDYGAVGEGTSVYVTTPVDVKGL
jgi:alpha-tubulin suppressor-like RCC1 family protein